MTVCGNPYRLPLRSQQTLGPFTADSTGDNLPIIWLEKDDITTAALYLQELGLIPDALRLTRRLGKCIQVAGLESLGITAAGLSEEERDRWD